MRRGKGHCSDGVGNLESQLARGAREITPQPLEKFSHQRRAQLHDNAPSLRKAHQRMLEGRVEVWDEQSLISGSKAGLQGGIAYNVPRLEGVVPVFGQPWCRLQDSNL